MGIQIDSSILYSSGFSLTLKKLTKMHSFNVPQNSTLHNKIGFNHMKELNSTIKIKRNNQANQPNILIKSAF